MRFKSNWPARNSEFSALCLVSLVCIGCQHAPSTPPPTGQASFRVVEIPAALSAGGDKTLQLPVLRLGDTRRSFAEAYPHGDLPSPAYPAAALAAHAGWVIIGVRITIDVNGRVSEVQPSPLGLSNAGRFSDLFMQAVSQTMQNWHFFPARIRTETVLRSEERPSTGVLGAG